MLKCTVIVILVLFAATINLAYEIIPIVKSDQDLKHDGSYHYTYETANGISHKAVGGADEVKGNYKYTSPEGEDIEVIYTGGVNGFQPFGVHIPAVPEHVLRMLEYQRTHPRVYDPYNHGL